MKNILVCLLFFLFTPNLFSQHLSAGYVFQLSNDKDFNPRHGCFGEFTYELKNTLLGTKIATSFARYPYSAFTEVNGNLVKTDKIVLEKSQWTALSFFYCYSFLKNYPIKLFAGPAIGASYSNQTGNPDFFRPHIGAIFKLVHKDLISKNIGLQFGIAPTYLINTGELLDAKYALANSTVILEFQFGLTYIF